MKQFVTTAIVLRRTNYSEADRILTLLTPEQGKIRLLAKGVRKIKSKLAGGIELFSITNLTYVQGKGDLGTLISSRLQTNFGNIVADISRTMFAYEVLKLIDSITEDNPEDEYYTLLAVTLDALNRPQISITAIQLWLYLHILMYGGHQPNVSTSPDGARLLPEDQFTFSLEDMAFVPHAQGLYDADAIKLLRLGLTADHPRQLSQIQNSHQLQLQLIELVRAMHAEHGRTF